MRKRWDSALDRKATKSNFKKFSLISGANSTKKPQKLKFDKYVWINFNKHVKSSEQKKWLKREERK